MNKYLEKVAYRYPTWFEGIDSIRKMNNQLKFFKSRVEGIRNARKQLMINNSFAPSTKRRYK